MTSLRNGAKSWSVTCALLLSLVLLPFCNDSFAQHHRDDHRRYYQGMRDHINGNYDQRYRRYDNGYYNNNNGGGIGPGYGALIGGGGGAALGALFGGGLKGALIGGAAGAGLGALGGKLAEGNNGNDAYYQNGYYRHR